MNVQPHINQSLHVNLTSNLKTNDYKNFLKLICEKKTVIMQSCVNFSRSSANTFTYL